MARIARVIAGGYPHHVTRCGKRRWTFETGELISGSTLVADGKVYVGSEKGNLWVLAAGPELRLLGKVPLGSPIYTTPVAANGCLYVATCKHLFAFSQEAR
jgi:outer membrane protein assembly factor BamB